MATIKGGFVTLEVDSIDLEEKTIVSSLSYDDVKELMSYGKPILLKVKDITFGLNHSYKDYCAYITLLASDDNTALYFTLGYATTSLYYAQIEWDNTWSINIY